MERSNFHGIVTTRPNLHGKLYYKIETKFYIEAHFTFQKLYNWFVNLADSKTWIPAYKYERNCE